MKVLEQNGTIQTFQDGALFNFLTFRRQNGALTGCTIYQENNAQVSITKGTLIIRGFRVVYENEVLFNSSVFPASEEMRYIILRINVTANGATAYVTTQVAPPMYSTPIEQSFGIFDYLLASFKYGPSGISNLLINITQLEFKVEQNITGQWELIGSQEIIAVADGEIMANTSNIYAYIMVIVFDSSKTLYPENYIIYQIPVNEGMNVVESLPIFEQSYISISSTETTLLFEAGWLVYEGDPYVGGSVKVYGLRR